MCSFQHMARTLAKPANVEPAHVREYVRQGPKTTAQLQALTGLSQVQVWGRLKAEMERGHVKREADRFVWCVPQDIEAALQLLRSHGYQVNKARLPMSKRQNAV